MTLWGGRFGEEPSEAMWAFTRSVADRRLLEADVIGSIAHVAALGEAGILKGDEVAALTSGLQQILEEARIGGFEWSDDDEDVHTAVERRLVEIAGEVAGKLHTGRSRNDQVAVDLRIYLAAAAAERRSAIRSLASVLADRAEEAGETIVPLYTHLQQAQAVPLAHHLLAHAWALLRDGDRFGDAAARIGVSPLGAGAGGGSRLPLRPDVAAGLLGFDSCFENSIDAVGSRDAAAEYLWCCAQTMVDLSRLAEEITLWATSEFGWATLADRHATGSSALPQKKNPDAAELTRGKAGSAIGHLTGLLGVIKGLPLAYDRDLQEDKEHLFVADDDLAGALSAVTEIMTAIEFHPPRPAGWVGALDLAEVLVERGVPFREAHDIVGRVVARSIEAGRSPDDLADPDLQQIDDRFRDGDVGALDPEASVAARRSPGGGSFESVRVQLEAIRRLLD